MARSTEKAIKNGKITITSATVAEPLSATENGIARVVVKALAGNGGTIYVGNSACSSATGFALAAGEEIPIIIDDLAAVYFDASTSAQGITYIAT